MKKWFFTLCLLMGMAGLIEAIAQPAFRVIHINFWLDSVDFGQQTIHARHQVSFEGVQSDSVVALQLSSGLIVDSIRHGAAPVSFTRTGEVLRIAHPVSAGVLDSLTIFYHGRPLKDAAWGGVYFQNGPSPYVYNLGVGFYTNPHSLGRAWMPCREEFTQKATIDFYLWAPPGNAGLANGVLVDSPSTASPYWHWRMRHPIPAYLMAWAVGPFHTIDLTADTIPTLVYALAGDTGKVRGSFANVQAMKSAYLDRYGPYRFDKLSYLLIPMNGGMEHAGFIAYGRNLVDGTTRYESVITHEMSHQWWGDRVTAADEGEMWINEGWATFSEWIYYEHHYGRAAMVDAMRDVISKLVHRLPIDRPGEAVAPVPWGRTYDGMLVYERGGLTAHNLRHYMGDSLFFHSIQQLMNAGFINLSSAGLRDSFEKYSGLSLDDFFQDWVWKPGFPLFQIRRVDTLSPTSYRVHIAQHLRGAPTYYTHVPLDVTAFRDGEPAERQRVVLDGAADSFVVSFSQPAELLWLHPDNELAAASVSRRWRIADTLPHEWPYGYVTFRASAVTDTAMVIIAHRWVNPDSQTVGNIAVNPNRYWTVGTNGSIQGRITFYYLGRSGGGRTGRVDYPFIRKENRLVLLYRPHPGRAWQVDAAAVQNMGSPTDYNGTFETDLRPGDYTIGKLTAAAALRKWFQQKTKFFLDGQTLILDRFPERIMQAYWINEHGQIVATLTPTPFQKQFRLPTVPPQPLWLILHTREGLVRVGPVTVP